MLWITAFISYFILVCGVYQSLKGAGRGRERSKEIPLLRGESLSSGPYIGRSFALRRILLRPHLFGRHPVSGNGSVRIPHLHVSSPCGFQRVSSARLHPDGYSVGCPLSSLRDSPPPASLTGLTPLTRRVGRHTTKFTSHLKIIKATCEKFTAAGIDRSVYRC